LSALPHPHFPPQKTVLYSCTSKSTLTIKASNGMHGMLTYKDLLPQE